MWPSNPLIDQVLPDDEPAPAKQQDTAADPRGFLACKLPDAPACKPPKHRL